MEQQIHFCTTHDGARIAYATAGHGPPLVKAANWLSHLEYDWQSPIWRHLLNEFARDHIFIRYDERGNGLSDWNVADLSFNAWVEDLESVVNAAKVDRFPLLGISQGGAVAIAYAVRHPEKVSHLILYGAYARGWITRDSAEEIEQRQAQLTLVRLGWGKDNPAFRQLWTSLYAPDATQEQAQSFNDLQRVSTSPENAVKLLTEMGHVDVVDLLPQVKVPTLVLHCRDEAGVPFEEGRKIAAIIPGARFVPLEGRNHLLLEGAPSWGTFVKEIRRFIGSEITSPMTQTSGSSIKAKPNLHRTDLPDRYSIISFLGVGGMGEVFLAEDTKLGRKVALKTLPAEFTDDKERLRRFQHEARAASGLNHPNLLTIHEIGAEAGAHFMATEYVDGDTLRTVIKRGRMKVDDALDVAQQTAFALTAAHGAGIVHRDIKPENIMVRKDGIVKVLDFGLAKLLEDHAREMVDHEADTRALVLTDPGRVLGTPQYMSPEQARGIDLDARTDVWSLGVVLYEMLAGRAPFQGETKSHTVVSILETEPPPITTFAPGTPAELQRIVRKALTKDRDSRYQTARDLMIDLKTLRRDLDIQSEIDRSNLPREKTSNQSTSLDVGSQQVAGLTETRSTGGDRNSPDGSVRYRVGALVVMLLIALIALGIYFWRRGVAPVETGAIDSIAVLPLVDSSGDANMEYLSDGITEDLINSLSQIPKLRVIPRVSVFRYKAHEIDPQKVARDLNVRAVLMGKIVQRGDTLSVQLDLVDVAQNRQLWGGKYERKLSDIIALQDEIAGEISEKLSLQLSADEKQQLRKHFTQNADAYQLYLNGRYHWKKYTRDELLKSIDYFNQAIDKDPRYALAYSGLADAYVLLGILFLPPTQVMAKARAAAETALKLDESLAAAHISMGAYKLFYEWDWTGAEREAQRAKELNGAYAKAIELNTNYDDDHHFYCTALDTSGRPLESIAEMRRALELDPMSTAMNMEMGWSFYISRDYDQSIAQCRKAMEMDANFALAYLCTAQSYEQQRKYDQAIADATRARTLMGDDPTAIEELAYAYALAGQKNEARKLAEALKAKSNSEYLDPTLIALVYTALGEKDEAFRWLDKAYAARSPWMTWLKVEPKFDPLRSDSRFSALMHRVGIG